VKRPTTVQPNKVYLFGKNIRALVTILCASLSSIGLALLLPRGKKSIIYTCRWTNSPRMIFSEKTLYGRQRKNR